MRVLLTGASSFLARETARRLRAVGNDYVFGVSRAGAPLPDVLDVHAVDLGDSIAPFAKVVRPEVAVHFANAEGPGAWNLNVHGTLRWIEELAAAGVQRQVFMSSISAHRDAPTAYGQAKLAVEDRARDRGVVALRPGLVVGNGGLFASLLALVQRAPVVPAVGGRHAYIHVTALETLLDAIVMATEGVFGRHGRPVWLQQRNPVALRHLIRGMLVSCGRPRAPVIPVPYPIALAGARVLAVLGGDGFGLDPDRVAAMRFNSRQRYPSDLQRFGLQEFDVLELLAQLESGRSAS